MNLILFIVFLSGFQTLTNSLQCLNSNGKPVDWWVILSIPDSAKEVSLRKHFLQRDHFQAKYQQKGYGYMDSNSAKKQNISNFDFFKSFTYEDNTALYKTLNQINKKNYQVVAWSDQPPEGYSRASAKNAHSKFVGAYDKSDQTGFFISHSVPRYPDFNNDKINITINNSQQMKGQDMLCMSGNKIFFQDIVKQLYFMDVYIYHTTFKNCLNKLKKVTPQNNKDRIQCLVKQMEVQEEAKNHQYIGSYSTFSYPISSQTNLIAIFKKHRNVTIEQIQQELKQKFLVDQVAKYLESSIISQTQHGLNQKASCVKNIYLNPQLSKDKNSSCTQIGQYKSQQVKGINFRVDKNKNYTWNVGIDHSKWIVAQNNTYVCFGDMNRQQKDGYQNDQRSRGGAFYCLDSPGLHKVMWNLIDQNYQKYEYEQEQEQQGK